LAAHNSLFLSRHGKCIASTTPSTPPPPVSAAASPSPSRSAAKFQLGRDLVLDPGSALVTKWNHIFLVTSLLTLFLDPLYFYLPVIGGPACMQIDVGLGVFITFLRTIADLFHLLHMVMKFRTAFVAPSSRVFGRGELVVDSSAIASRYLRSDFLVDLAATLPLPQVNRQRFIIFLSLIMKKDKSSNV
jgi:cyclic nucleotide gated channel